MGIRTMHTTVEIDGRRVEITTSKEADIILKNRKLPLVVEMDLMFDMLFSKKVRFLTKNESSDSAVNVSEKLSTSFRPVMLQCQNLNGSSACEVTDFPLKRLRPYVPKWLRIDFRFGHWYGEFGY